MKVKLSFLIVLIGIILGSCSPKVIYLPSNTDTHTEYRDSVVYKVDTLRIPVPVETVREVVPPMDTLSMETSVAEAKAWVDTTTNALKGVLKNKKTALSQPQVVYKEKIAYRDSLVYKEVPVPVEVEKIVKRVPWWAKFLSTIGGLALAAAALYILRKLHIL